MCDVTHFTQSSENEADSPARLARTGARNKKGLVNLDWVKQRRWRPNNNSANPNTGWCRIHGQQSPQLSFPDKT